MYRRASIYRDDYKMSLRRVVAVAIAAAAAAANAAVAVVVALVAAGAWLAHIRATNRRHQHTEARQRVHANCVCPTNKSERALLVWQRLLLVRQLVCLCLYDYAAAAAVALARFCCVFCFCYVCRDYCRA